MNLSTRRDRIHVEQETYRGDYSIEELVDYLDISRGDPDMEACLGRLIQEMNAPEGTGLVLAAV